MRGTKPKSDIEIVKALWHAAKRKHHKTALEQAKDPSLLFYASSDLFYWIHGSESSINLRGNCHEHQQRLHCLMQHAARKTLLCALALVGIHSALSGSVYAQAVQPPIAYGQTIQGSLGSPGDDVLSDGRPIDRYRLVTQAPEQTYVIRATSLQIPLVSSISFINTAGQQVPLQQAQVFFSGQQVLYAGTLPQPGIYIINVYALDTQRPVGGYTLSLRGGDDNGVGDIDLGDDNGVGDDDLGDDNGGRR
jgi:hypothetical protein